MTTKKENSEEKNARTHTQIASFRFNIRTCSYLMHQFLCRCFHLPHYLALRVFAIHTLFSLSLSLISLSLFLSLLPIFSNRKCIFNVFMGWLSRLCIKWMTLNRNRNESKYKMCNVLCTQEMECITINHNASTFYTYTHCFSLCSALPCPFVLLVTHWTVCINQPVSQSAESYVCLSEAIE